MLNFWNFSKDKKTGITIFNLNPCDFEKWLNQNHGEYTGCFVDGCLQDNFVIATKRGYAFFYEHVRNSWASDYTVYFIPYKSGEKHEKVYDILWRNWYEFAERAERETA